MANQTFANLLINDKQFYALQLPPKIPTTSNTNEPKYVTEGSEILFQARNVLKTYENPSLSFLGSEEVPAPINSPNHEDLAQDAEYKLKAKMKRMQANRMYAARYRLRKVARIQQLVRQIECLEEEVKMIRSRLHYWESSHNKLVEENAKMRARFEAANKLNAEKKAENWILMQEIHRLKNNQCY